MSKDCGYCGVGMRQHSGRVGGGVCKADADVVHCKAASGLVWGAGVGDAAYKRMNDAIARVARAAR